MKGELEFRAGMTQGVEVRSVSFPQRIIEVVAMPYDRETEVEYRGRMVRESVAPGAFGTIATRPNRVNVYRDHDRTRQTGKALTFHPSRQEGLVAELLIGKTELGTETLSLAAEGMLDASAGFGVLTRSDGRPGEEWPERNTRRLTWLWLDHIAMVPDPAYQDARVLSVRQTGTDVRVEDGDAGEGLTAAPGGIVVATPNLDQARALRLGDMYARLSR
jgi:phage head maturation protease